MDYVSKGFVSAPVSRADMDDLFDKGTWRSLLRFTILQAGGKYRCSDGSKHSEHNRHVHVADTLFTIGTDWVPEHCTTVIQSAREEWNNTSGVPCMPLRL